MINWAEAAYTATSLFDETTGTPNKLGLFTRSEWLGLIDGSDATTLQNGCEKSGFNIDGTTTLARIGIVADDAVDCSSRFVTAIP